MSLENIEFVNVYDKKYVKIKDGINSLFELKEVNTVFPIKSLLCDLDGTLIKSEEFWINIVEKTVRKILDNKKFQFEQCDIKYVSGFSTIEHLQYCINKYVQDFSTQKAIEIYHEIAENELKAIAEGKGSINVFKVREGAEYFLKTLKSRKIKIGLATSGLNYKSIPEIISLCKQTNISEPNEFFDGRITGGVRKDFHTYGTLGEIAAKPYPFIYYELAKMGLKVENLNQTIGLEDSAAGVLSLRLAGINAIGFNDGNIFDSGLDFLCYKKANCFEEVLNLF